MDIKDCIKEVLPGSSSKKGMRASEIYQRLQENHPELFSDEEGDAAPSVEKIKSLLMNEAKKKSSEIVRVSPGAYRIKKAKPRGPIISDSGEISTNYLGKAGEYMVMAELLKRGYNANNMSVDEGIDIIASKDNIFYFVQVKTTQEKEKGKATVSVKKRNFATFFDNQMRYVIVVLMKNGRTRYFVFDGNAIEQLRHAGALSVSESNLNFKIRFSDSGKPFAYDEDEMAVDFWEDRFL